MGKMELVQGLRKVKKRHKGGVLTIGTFDGVHLGHQRLIESLRKRAKRLKKRTIILTFDIHPLKTINPAKCPPLLTSKEEKINIIQNLRVAILILVNFDKSFSSLSPAKFIRNILVERLGVAELFVGQDFVFGQGAAGDIAFLGQQGEEYGFKVRLIPPVKMERTTISSTAIRRLLGKGEVKQAAKFLGRPYTLYGRVVPGKACGRKLGYPTANIKPSYCVMIPSDGVYLGEIRIKGNNWNGLLNIGTQPTFYKDGAIKEALKGHQGEVRGRKRVIEAHIFDFNQKIYGQDIRISFLKKIRNEIAFRSPKSLKTQINKDIASARKILHLS